MERPLYLSSISSTPSPSSLDGMLIHRRVALNLKVTGTVCIPSWRAVMCILTKNTTISFYPDRSKAPGECTGHEFTTPPQLLTVDPDPLDQAVKCFKMIVQKNSSTGSFPIIILVMSVLLCCGGFFRVELVLNLHKGRIIVLQEAVERLKTILNDGSRKVFKNAIHGKLVSFWLPMFIVYIRECCIFFIFTRRLHYSERLTQHFGPANLF